jgi:hypothetical protein
MWSLIGFFGSSSVTIFLMTSFTDVEDTFPIPLWSALLKRYLKLNVPRSQDKNLFDVTRLTVLSCRSKVDATSFSVRAGLPRLFRKNPFEDR